MALTADTHRSCSSHQQRRHRQHSGAGAVIHDCCALQCAPLLQGLQPAQAEPRGGVVPGAKGQACRRVAGPERCN